MNFFKRQIHFLHNNNLLKQEKEYLDIQNSKKYLKEMEYLKELYEKSLIPFVLIDLLVSDDKGQFHAIILLLCYVSLGIVYFPSINHWLITHKL